MIGNEKWLTKWERQLSIAEAHSRGMNSNNININTNMLWRLGHKEALSKLVCSFIYAVAASFLTCLTMTLAHERVPDREKFPPLPDLFLDNIQVCI